MSKTMPHNAHPAERRAMPRGKKVLLSGVITDLEGKHVHDCTIRDMSAEGAQIALDEELPLASEAYLLDVRNQVAYLANVVWTGSGHSGLSFLEAYELTAALPPHLSFLKTLVLEAKLRQMLRLAQRGISSEEARTMVGLMGADVSCKGSFRPRLLAVDDDLDCAELIARVAAKCGYEAKSITDASALGPMLSEWNPQVLTLDLCMPEQDGITLLSSLKENGFGGQLLIISGKDEWFRKKVGRLASQRGLNVSFDLCKPIDLKTLREALVELASDPWLQSDNEPVRGQSG